MARLIAKNKYNPFMDNSHVGRGLKARFRYGAAKTRVICRTKNRVT